MRKIGVVGDKDSVLCFKALGLEVFPVAPGDFVSAGKIVERLAREQYAIVLVTENFASGLEETLDRHRGGALPAIIPIPGGKGTSGAGLERIRGNVEKAVGVNILDEGRQT